MPDLVSLVVALVTFLRRGLRSGESDFERGVSRQWIERRLVALSCAILHELDDEKIGRGLAVIESDEPDKADSALSADIRARLGALAPEERRLTAYRLMRAFAVDAAPSGAEIEWDESVALYLGSGEKALVWGLTSFRPSSLALGLIGRSDAEAWCAIAVGLVAAALPRKPLSMLRARAHAEGCASRIPQWTRDRLHAGTSAERAEEALSFVLDVLCFDVWKHRRALDRAIVREGTEPFWQYLHGVCVAAAPPPESPRERTMLEVSRELDRLSPPFQAHAFFVSETEDDSRVTPLSREELLSWLAQEIASPEQSEQSCAGLREIVRNVEASPAAVAILVQCEDPDGVDLILASPELATNARGGEV